MANAFTEWEHPPSPETDRADLGGLSLSALRALRFEELGRFKRAGSFPGDYNPDTLTFYAPRDPGLHQVIIWTLMQATTSVAVNMYGFDDPHAAALIEQHTEEPHVAVTLTLDSTQAAGPQGKKILSRFNHDLIGNSIAIGRSERGALSHDKLLIVDGHYLVSGSTNWSYGGELLQDNQLTLTRDRAAAAEASGVIAFDHDAMLKQMATKRPAARSRRRAAPKSS